MRDGQTEHREFAITQTSPRVEMNWVIDVLGSGSPAPLFATRSHPHFHGRSPLNPVSQANNRYLGTQIGGLCNERKEHHADQS
jgi:hypothetical protein